MNTDRKKAMLGSTRRVTPRGGFVATYPDLSTPPKSKEACVRYFCTGCGFLGELDRETALDILSVDEADWTGKYIQCSACSVCSGNEFNDAKLLSVPEQTKES